MCISVSSEIAILRDVSTLAIGAYTKKSLQSLIIVDRVHVDVDWLQDQHDHVLRTPAIWGGK